MSDKQTPHPSSSGMTEARAKTPAKSPAKNSAKTRAKTRSVADVVKTSAGQALKAGARRSLFRRIVRAFTGRPKLFLCVLLGLIVATLAPADWRTVTRLVAGWDVCIVAYLAIVFTTVTRAEVKSIRLHASEQDEGRFALLFLISAAGIASLGAIIAELASQSASRTPEQITLAIATVALSWAFIHIVFAVHYAHEFYGEGGSQSGINFPGGTKEPTYADFLYFSFVIGMTSQVSDVTVSARVIRKTVLAHGILSFFFNVTLLALTINIVASAL